MLRIVKVAAIAVAVSLTTVGCSSAAGGPADEISADAPSGDTITGTGYSFTVPEGWAEPGDEVDTSGVDALVADLDDADGFADNVNVVLTPSGEVTADQVESQGVDELENAGATDVTVRDRVSVAGSESAHLAAGFSSNGSDYQIEQYYLTHDGQTYVVTFSFSPQVAESDRDGLSESVLASWEWA